MRWKITVDDMADLSLILKCFEEDNRHLSKKAGDLHRKLMKAFNYSLVGYGKKIKMDAKMFEKKILGD